MSFFASFGLVTAEPHQHLVVVRDGHVRYAAQGGRAWRWPGDAVAWIDTSVRRLQFTADQVTREKTGVAVTGLAVWRVVEPLVAWRMLDLADGRRVEEILREMFVGATRRLVANLSLEDCLTRRKDALAAELVAEVAPVVAGSGSPEDANPRGWGLALDTIEIQDVRVLSGEVFERLQAPYRAALQLDAVRAHAEVDVAEARVREEADRRAEEHRRAMLSHAQARVEAERARAREDEEHRAALESARQAAARAVELARAEAAVSVAEREAAAVRVRAEADAERVRLERAAVDGVSEARLRELLLTHTVPEAARALRGLVGEVNVRPGDLDDVVALVGRIAAATRA